MDYLSIILQRLEERNKIKGIEINGFNLTHLLFTDDIFLLVEDNDEYIRNMQFAIHLFECATSLNIKKAKSTISHISINKEKANMDTNSWGFNTQFMLFSYLGMPLGRKLSLWLSRITSQ